MSGLMAVEAPRRYGRVIMTASQLWPYRSRAPAVSQSHYSRAVGGGSRRDGGALRRCLIRETQLRHILIYKVSCVGGAGHFIAWFHGLGALILTLLKHFIAKLLGIE